MSMDQFNVTEGTEVYGSDGEKVGSVVAVQPNHVIVEKGFFFPTDFYIPMSAITSVEDNKAYLNVSKDQALNQGWDTEPTGDYATTTATTADMGGYERDVSRADAGATRVTDDDTMRVDIHEEELTATKSAREIGQVRIEKDVISEEQRIDVPLTEERVRVNRVAVDRAADANDATAFEGGTIEVPIRGEEVQVHKDVRVTGEVEIDKEQVERTEQVGGTVRREEVRVSEDVVDVDRKKGRNA